MSRAELTLTVEVDAPAEQTWTALVDWDSQGEWMLGTTVSATTHEGRGVGGGLEAFTGVWRLGFLDTMVITEWEPPTRCVVRHTGRVVRGLGIFEVRTAGDRRSRVIWTEQLELPFGVLGRVGWRLGRPAFRYGVLLSLRRFAAQAAARSGS